MFEQGREELSEHLVQKPSKPHDTLCTIFLSLGRVAQDWADISDVSLPLLEGGGGDEGLDSYRLYEIGVRAEPNCPRNFLIRYKNGLKEAKMIGKTIRNVSEKC